MIKSGWQKDLLQAPQLNLDYSILQLMSSLPDHVGRKLSLNGWFVEDGKGNKRQEFSPCRPLRNENTPKSTIQPPQPVEPKWKPSEPVYYFPFFKSG